MNLIKSRQMIVPSLHLLDNWLQIVLLYSLPAVCLQIIYNYFLILFFWSIAVAVFADHMNLPEVKFACDGSLFKKHPKMERLINSYLSVMCPNRKVVVFSADQGSGIGAAMLAAVVMDSSMKWKYEFKLYKSCTIDLYTRMNRSQYIQLFLEITVSTKIIQVESFLYISIISCYVVMARIVAPAMFMLMTFSNVCSN